MKAEITLFAQQLGHNMHKHVIVPQLHSTFAVRETASLGIMGASEVPPLCRETQSLGQQMLNAQETPSMAEGTWEYLSRTSAQQM